MFLLTKILLPIDFSERVFKNPMIDWKSGVRQICG